MKNDTFYIKAKDVLDKLSMEDVIEYYGHEHVLDTFDIDEIAVYLKQSYGIEIFKKESEDDKAQNKKANH